MQHTYQGGSQRSFRRHQDSTTVKASDHATQHIASEIQKNTQQNSSIELELVNISKSYAQGNISVNILSDVNLVIPRGKIIGIIGASGSGKSTLLHISGLLDSEFAGKVLINGQDTKKMSSSQKDKIRLNYLGFVYQYHHLLRDFTARENAAMPQIIAGTPKNIALEMAEALLASLGLAKRLNNYPGELSGGEQQRVAIARSIINNPSVILADEPTGNLDHAAAEVVMDLFLNLARATELSAAIVTHNERIAAKMDEVYSLNSGKLIKV